MQLICPSSRLVLKRSGVTGGVVGGGGGGVGKRSGASQLEIGGERRRMEVMAEREILFHCARNLILELEMRGEEEETLVHVIILFG